jgi:hypothetical protein
MTTDAWAAIPDVPWTTQDGTSFKDLGAECSALIPEIRAAFPGAGEIGLGLLAERVTELTAALRALVRTELLVEAVYSRGWRDSDASRSPRPRKRHLRIAGRPG